MHKYGKQYLEEAGGDGQGGGGGQTSWRDGLSDDYKNAPAFKDFTDLNAFAKSHIDLNAHLGQSVRIPSADAKPEDMQAFYTKMIDKVPGLTAMPNPDDAEATAAFWAKAGVPAEATGYALPEGIDPTSAPLSGDLALKAGLTLTQFKSLSETLSGASTEGYEKAKADLKAEQDKVFYEWGAAKNDKLAAINVLLKNSGAPDTLLSAVSDLNVGADFLSWADGLVKAIGGEGSQLVQQENTPAGYLTPSEAESRIAEMMGNKEHPFWKAGDPGNAEAKKRMVELVKMAGGKK